MKNYLIKLSVLLSLLFPISAFALQDVSLGSSTIIGVGGINLTISGSSLPDSIVVDTNSFTVTLSNNASLTIVSADKRTMTFSQPAGSSQLTTTLTCNTSDSTYLISNPTAGATGLQITVTPTTSTCSSASAGGSGGGGSSSGSSGGGGGSSSVASTPAVTATTASTVTLSTPAPVAVVVPATPGTVRASAILLSRQLSYGERSSEVEKLQEALSRDDSIYPEGLKTGLFGPMTRRAVQRFQEKYGIAKAGTVGYGVVGPKTRAKFNEVYGSSSTTASATALTSTVSATKLELIQNLLKQITVLQEALKQLQASQ